jgi:hypothetical protein
MENKYYFISFSLFSFLFIFQQAAMADDDEHSVDDETDDENNSTINIVAKMIYEFIFNYKNLKIGTLFLCRGNNNDNNNGGNLLPLIKYLTMKNLMIKFYYINDNIELIDDNNDAILQWFQIRNNAEFVVLEDGCENSRKLLKQVRFVWI